MLCMQHACLLCRRSAPSLPTPATRSYASQRGRVGSPKTPTSRPTNQPPVDTCRLISISQTARDKVGQQQVKTAQDTVYRAAKDAADQAITAFDICRKAVYEAADDTVKSVAEFFGR